MRSLSLRLIDTLVALGLMGLGAAAQAQTPLDLGLAPYISTRTLLATFEPLSTYLEKALHRPVMLTTAPTLEDYDERLLEKSYDLAVVSPHAARNLQREHDYEPLLRFSADLYGVFLVRSDSPMQSMRDISQAPIAFPQRTSATTLLGREVLERYGIGMAQVVYPHTFQDSMLLGPIQGEYPVALVNAFVLGRVTPEQRGRLRIIGHTRKISHLMLVARTDMPPVEKDNLQRAIVEFMEKTPEGARFLKETGLGGVRPPTESELRSLDPLAAELRRIWEELRISARPSR